MTTGNDELGVDRSEQETRNGESGNAESVAITLRHDVGIAGTTLGSQNFACSCGGAFYRNIQSDRVRCIICGRSP
jgi:hypothetical protein